MTCSGADLTIGIAMHYMVCSALTLYNALCVCRIGSGRVVPAAATGLPTATRRISASSSLNYLTTNNLIVGYLRFPHKLGGYKQQRNGLTNSKQPTYGPYMYVSSDRARQHWTGLDSPT